MAASSTCPGLIGRTERVWSEVGLPLRPNSSHAIEMSERTHNTLYRSSTSPHFAMHGHRDLLCIGNGYIRDGMSLDLLPSPVKSCRCHVVPGYLTEVIYDHELQTLLYTLSYQMYPLNFAPGGLTFSYTGGIMVLHVAYPLIAFLQSHFDVRLACKLGLNYRKKRAEYLCCRVRFRTYMHVDSLLQLLLMCYGSGLICLYFEYLA